MRNQGEKKTKDRHPNSKEEERKKSFSLGGAPSGYVASI
jgi:hypothetical protein